MHGGACLLQLLLRLAAVLEAMQVDFDAGGDERLHLVIDKCKKKVKMKNGSIEKQSVFIHMSNEYTKLLY